MTPHPTQRAAFSSKKYYYYWQPYRNAPFLCKETATLLVSSTKRLILNIFLLWCSFC